MEAKFGVVIPTPILERESLAQWTWLIWHHCKLIPIVEIDVC